MESNLNDISNPIQNTFCDYLESNESIKKEVSEIIEGNGETYFFDLNKISDNINTDNNTIDDNNTTNNLYYLIQNNFIKNYIYLNKAFEIFCLKNFNKKIDLSFYNPAIHCKIREIKSNILGNLISFSGTVTRTSQVRPELVKASFKCKACGYVIDNINQQYKFTEPIFCYNHLCSNRSNFEILIEKCEFSNWQRINIQESTEEIPKGSLPRSLDLIVRNELCEKIKPGNHLKFTGYPVVIPDITNTSITTKSIKELQGIYDENNSKKKSIGKELNYKISFFCIHADIFDKNITTNLSVINKIQSTPDLYNKLAESLFPSIHGHSNIKCAILLMLVSGVSKKSNNIKLRGDINVLLVGDPGTAKSQFLKQTSSLLPSSVYTSGKSSSAAGLTAAVIKDSNGEFTIEAGALMLSDQGICCIDEFDKMTFKDQVSIHEAMEQQTITIAKAGINATLNSRTSILAAANPIKGRYDKRKTLKQNVNLSPAIMSRFDLYFVLIDKIDPENDKKISKYILNNHLLYNSDNVNDNINISNNNSLFSLEESILFINNVKERNVKISEEAKNEMVDRYIKLRQDSLINTNNYKMTVRHLESLIRLSEALAKIHNTDVTISHIDEAYRLLKSSLIEIKSDDIILSRNIDDLPEYSISNKEYLKITNSLIYLIKSNLLTKEEVIIKYLEMIEEQLENTFMLETEKEKSEKVLEFLIQNEGVIYELDNYLYIHPNYDN